MDLDHSIPSSDPISRHDAPLASQQKGKRSRGYTNTAPNEHKKPREKDVGQGLFASQHQDATPKGPETATQQLRNDAEEDETSSSEEEATLPQPSRKSPTPTARKGARTGRNPYETESDDDDTPITMKDLKRFFLQINKPSTHPAELENIQLRKTIKNLQSEITKLRKSLSATLTSTDNKIDALTMMVQNAWNQDKPTSTAHPDSYKLWSEVAAERNRKQVHKPAKAKPTKPGPPPIPPRPILPTRQERTLVVTTRNEDLKNHNPIEIRNVINKALKTAAAPSHVVVSEVTFSGKNNLVLRTRNDCRASEVESYSHPVMQAIRVLDSQASTIMTTETWAKVAVHGIPTEAYQESEEGMKELKAEIEAHNSGIYLMALPRFMVRKEARENKAATSFILSFSTQHDANQIIRNGLAVHGSYRKCGKYYTAAPTDQCRNCFRFGHAWQRCKAPPVCRLCAGPHNARHHECTNCNITGSTCIHIPKKCALCSGHHFASDRSCPQRTTLIQARLRNSDGPVTHDDVGMGSQ